MPDVSALAAPKRKPREPGAAAQRDTFLHDPRDNAAACRVRAAADLAEADTRSTINGRGVLEASAAQWTARAALLQRLENSFEARKLAGGEAPLSGGADGVSAS
ncbi:hypothetical protein [Sphingomonas sp.]|uniref:hypothetical protein n=1 Tax=Sphingomonas sp. TaxID=28214 RepID=UPI00286EA9E8|nr:hypothetical protein [Sphingomonas sp.]